MQTIHYGDHPAQYAELSLPAGTSLVPVVVVVHGGFWRDAYGADLGRPLARDLVNRGWAALNVEYRRVGGSPTDGGGGWPTTCLDVAAAVDTLAVEGQRIAGGRLDLGRVVALGHSAGGHLAGWLASRARQAEGAPGANPQVTLSGAVIQAGVVDLEGGFTADLGGGAVRGFMGGSPAELAETYAQASPIDRVPLHVPTVCVHGRSDDVVPIEQSQAFVAAALAAGDHAELKPFDGDHMDVVDTEHQGWELCVEALQQLL
ncbi:alpha/beta hydrolase family protein [Microlunatus flavus]|uniref:Prolyl oligopeptidase family protein n=1 Tax=Microlunatus flavus TaxID=1036181 RepID=A0A1H9B2T8_9ACTN|nr:alpha/beta hydrolase [Microlunatus flavus]SEP83047.1 Prolyl oligopeptidase family protein [Microlunatus flavus]